MASLPIAACALALLSAAWWAQLETARLQQHPEPGQPLPVLPVANASTGRNSMASFPPDSQYFKDLGIIQKISEELSMNSGVIEYKLDANPKLALNVRNIDLRVNDDYSKLKRFLSMTLDTLPNATLREIRVERKDAATLKSAILIKLALIYSNVTPDAKDSVQQHSVAGESAAASTP